MSNASKTFGLFENSFNRKTIMDYEAQGTRVIRFPKVIKKSVDLSENDRVHLLDLQHFEWVVFTDVYSVDFFLEFLESNNVDFFELDDLRVIAFGEAVADRLRFVQLHADIIAERIEAKSVFQNLADYLFDADGFRTLKVMVVKCEDINQRLCERLKKASSKVTEISIYRTELEENPTKIKVMLKGGAFDEVFLDTVDEVFDLSLLLESGKLPETLKESVVFTKDKIAWQALREFGVEAKLLTQKKG